jgi:hypothetical protein
MCDAMPAGDDMMAAAVALLFTPPPERRRHRRRRHLCPRELEARDANEKRDECVQREMDECMPWPKRLAVVGDHEVDVGFGEERQTLWRQQRPCSRDRTPRPGHIAASLQSPLHIRMLQTF